MFAAILMMAGCAAEKAQPRYLYPPVGAACPAVDPRQRLSSAAPLNEEFWPITAAICTFDVVVRPGPGGVGGGWRWRTVRRSQGPFGDLITALRTPPPTHRERGAECPGAAQKPMYIALIDRSGRAVIPAIPADTCGFRLDSVDQAVERLNWVTVESR